VSLVEAVGGETAELAEDLFRSRPFHAARHRLLDEGAPDLVHLFHGTVVRHGAAQQISLGE